MIVPYSMAPVVLSSFCGLFMLVPTEGISMAVLVFTVLVAAVAPAAAALSHHPEEHSTDENEPDNIFHGYPIPFRSFVAPLQGGWLGTIIRDFLDCSLTRQVAQRR